MINRGISADLQITINSSRVFPPGKAEASRLSRIYISGVYVEGAHARGGVCRIMDRR